VTRALLIVLDSVGIGGAPDAAEYGDLGADTVGHIAEACARGFGDRAGLRAGALRLPNLSALGLGLACEIATGRVPPHLAPPSPVLRAAWGAARETARGKDTVSGHWELAGVPLETGFGTFPDTRPAFAPELAARLVQEAHLPGILGDKHAPGTAILDELGPEHLRTGKPICYTSVDSVFQIAAHEEVFGLERLYETCLVARRLCDPLRIGRVIARPFTGSVPGGFVRTAHRRDFAMPPPATTLLDRTIEAGQAVTSIGKIGDIFAHRGTGREIKTSGNEAGIDAILAALSRRSPGGLIFANLVDFDTEHGHRRDVAGYAAALESFDRRLPEIVKALRPGDLAIVTADHGNDPTFRGTDHTREQIPVLAFGPSVTPGRLGARGSFADVGATLAEHLGLEPLGRGTSFLLTMSGRA
jgi:phosphopentomutase